MDEEERGYTPEETERGEDRAWHMPIWGCLLFTALVALVTYGLYTLP